MGPCLMHSPIFHLLTILKSLAYVTLHHLIFSISDGPRPIQLVVVMAVRKAVSAVKSCPCALGTENVYEWVTISALCPDTVT